MSSRRPETFKQSPSDHAFLENPYGAYETARELGPVAFWEDYGMPVAFGHAAAREILMHRRMGRAPLVADLNRPAHLSEFFLIEDHSMLELEAPDHTRLRRIVGAAFTAARIGSLSPEVSKESDRLIDALPDGPFDFISNFANPLAAKVITRLIGLPEEMVPEILRWNTALVAMYQVRRDRSAEIAANKAACEFRTFLLDCIENPRHRLDDGLLSALAAAPEDGPRLSADEMVSTCVLLLNAGHSAMVHALGNGLCTLLRLNQPVEAIMPTAVSGTVEELMRYDPPLHLFFREAYDHIRIGDCDLAPGDRIGVCLAAANRDPLVFEDPMTFDPTRPSKAHLSFGAGTHFCVGAPLARLELQVALPALHCPTLNFRLTEPPRFGNVYPFRGPETLMIERA